MNKREENCKSNKFSNILEFSGFEIHIAINNLTA